ncbi:ABC transporter ATP-binding protein [Kordiimonas sp. SCSIO 12603]|uniref:hypothetical protein n=1 Tax=Kordiimonas sp. SCSIO 12603 TaxID=2829596 RepID=UPI002104A811|nr:hypothetical protein [Kordiimonas sp. SCSIO 12603]UTW59306.1 ABC transporter ATP-binding protein [Kordiimonas sp. SCSIO 12603]
MQNPSSAASPQKSVSDLWHFIRSLLRDEKQFYWLAIIYGIGISLLTLAVPISVQMLINTVANTGLKTPLIGLSVTLFVLLMVSGLLNALRIHLMELFGRRFYARLVAEITLKTLYAQNPFFTDAGKNTLFNRYFDIVTVQKAVPYLLIGGFTIILQALVGFTIVSLYHPLFLGFNIGLVLLIWAVWGVWGNRAMLSAVALSHTKHNVAGWIESLGASNGYYKSRKHIERALEQSDKKTADYINSTKHHFKYTFSQALAFLVIYALASALLLGIGGWLVINGELSLGQLVAAELILSAVFYGISQLGDYLASFYDLTAATEELAHFFDVPQEVPAGTLTPRKGAKDLIFAQASGFARHEHVTFNLEIKAGASIFCAAPNAAVQRLFTDFLKHHERPHHGIVSFTGTDVLDIEVHKLRQLITILDRPTLIPGTIRNFLKAAEYEGQTIQPLEAIKIVGLESTIQSLSDGMDTQLSLTGAPLSLVEVLKLKLAAVLIAEPQVLVLTQLFDALPAPVLERTLTAIKANTGASILYFSNRISACGFDQFMLMASDTQQIIEKPEDFFMLRDRPFSSQPRNQTQELAS